MKSLRTTLAAFLFTAFLTLTGCSAGALTGPSEQAPTQDAPTHVDAPDQYNLPSQQTNDGNTNGGGSTDTPDGYNLDPTSD